MEGETQILTVNEPSFEIQPHEDSSFINDNDISAFQDQNQSFELNNSVETYDETASSPTQQHESLDFGGASVSSSIETVPAVPTTTTTPTVASSSSTISMKMAMSEKSASASKLAPSPSSGQVVKLPPIAGESAKLRSGGKGVLAPGQSAKLTNSSKFTKSSNNAAESGNSSISTQVTIMSEQSSNNKSGSTIPRNTFPSDSPVHPTAAKTRQPSVSRTSISSNTTNNSSLSSATGPLPEMKVASMKMQMAQKKVVPKSVSSTGGGVHLAVGNYRYKIMPGNNSRVVMTAMRKRPWWHAILGNNAAEAEDQNDLSAIQPTFLWEMIRRACRYRTNQFHNTLMNHIQKNNCLVTKKGLYLSLRSYCQEQNLDMLSIVPRTFYLAPGEHSKSMKDDDMEEFLQYCNNVPDRRPEELVWILKPASKTNRGFGIKVVQGLDRVMNIVQRGMSAGSTDNNNSGGGESGEEDDDDEDDNNNNNNNATAVTTSNNNNSNSNSLSAYDANPLNKQARMIARTDGYIVQAYLERPLLVHGRKFDIRCFVLVTVLPPGRKHAAANSVALTPTTSNTVASTATTVVEGEDAQIAQVAAAVEEQLQQQQSQTTSKAKGKNSTSLSPGKQRSINATKAANSSSSSNNTSTRSATKDKEVRAYFFQDAYIRTSCKKYVNANFSDRETHLTNDAVQKLAKSYGQFEEGNKLSLAEWEQVLLDEYPAISRPGIVMDQIYPEIKRLSKLSIASAAQELATTDIHKSFELFGYDYMIREDLSPVLIEVNTNPCLEFVCPLLTQIITDVIEHTMRMTVDKELPPPPKTMRTKATEEAIGAINSTPIRFDTLYP